MVSASRSKVSVGPPDTRHRCAGFAAQTGPVSFIFETDRREPIMSCLDAPGRLLPGS